jgi:hypothetical protein
MHEQACGAPFECALVRYGGKPSSGAWRSVLSTGNVLPPVRSARPQERAHVLSNARAREGGVTLIKAAPLATRVGVPGVWLSERIATLAAGESPQLYFADSSRTLPKVREALVGIPQWAELGKAAPVTGERS